MFPDREEIRLLGKQIENYINEALLAMSDVTSLQSDDISVIISLCYLLLYFKLLSLFGPINLEQYIACVIVIYILSGRLSR